MSSILVLGLLLGMKHALEADHVAAVASLSGGGQTLRKALHFGAVWGLGHTLTLFVVVSLVLLFGTTMPKQIAAGLEMAVGAMLMVLGSSVFYRLVRDRVHFHLHTHDGKVHFHAHSHASEGAHEQSNHHHTHVKQPNGYWRVLIVGLVHGLAGSAALVVLTVSATETLWQGMTYTLLFGLGSMAGMALLSVVIAVPLSYSARRATWLHNGLLGIVGLCTVFIGATLLITSGIAIA